jgi:hypothetical protein
MHKAARLSQAGTVLLLCRSYITGLDDAPSLNDPDQNGNDCQYQQNVNEAAYSFPKTNISD